MRLIINYSYGRLLLLLLLTGLFQLAPAQTFPYAIPTSPEQATPSHTLELSPLGPDTYLLTCVVTAEGEEDPVMDISVISDVGAVNIIPNFSIICFKNGDGADNSCVGEFRVSVKQSYTDAQQIERFKLLNWFQNKVYDERRDPNEENASQSAFLDNGPSLSAQPNPFSRFSRLEFSLPNDENAILKIYNLQGQVVKELFNGEAKAGQPYPLTWEAAHQPAGLYLARLSTASGAVKTVRILRIK